VRLRRADPAKPGYGRHRRGRGFSYVDTGGAPLRDADERARIRNLAIPPAWQDVWISPDPRGHIQATGTDNAGRRQYLYHPVWRQRRDAAKFDHVLDVAARLPRIRRTVTRHLDDRGLTQRRVLATAVRLLDRGLFRVGGEQYASGDDATFGLATLQVGHVRLHNGEAVFCYPAKGGTERECTVTDPARSWATPPRWLVRPMWTPESSTSSTAVRRSARRPAWTTSPPRPRSKARCWISWRPSGARATPRPRRP